MTLDASREIEKQDVPICLFCGGELDLGYHYTCQICGATYCYIHMDRHRRAHTPHGSQGMTSIPPVAGEPAARPSTVVLTSDPEEIALIRTYMTRLLLGGSSSDRPQPLEGSRNYC
jgi:hypothetical protein